MTDKKTRRILMLALASASLMLAQGRGPRAQGGAAHTPPDPATMVQRRVDMLTRRLGLTDAQKSQATTIFTQAQTSTAAARESLKSVNTQMLDAVKKNDTGTITTLSVTVGTLTSQLVAAERKADAACYAILTPEQKTIVDQGRGMMGFGMGFGGPGGPGGPGMRRGGPPQQ